MSSRMDLIDWIKVIAGGIFVLVVLLGIVMSFTGNNFQIWKKNLQTNYGDGLDRNVVVSNAVTGETLWTYSGKCYVDDSSEPGDLTVIYYDNEGNVKKADFIGNMINLSMTEN